MPSGTALVPGQTKPGVTVPGGTAKPGPAPARQAVLLGTEKLVGADTIVPLVVEKVTVVPCGMILPLTSVIVTRTVRTGGEYALPLTQVGNLTSTEFTGASVVPSLNWNTGSDPEKTIGKLRRT